MFLSPVFFRGGGICTQAMYKVLVRELILVTLGALKDNKTFVL